ncbi:hypothetical protein MSUIS_05490 [Mycoplasma suis KI3806]|uniref:Uncharacterized protein n=1 Tax=Mycoplasma suis (strain KI_3806) TaxID=708248 RepID=F0V1W1_MYCS3|nr:hypothetical protein [Mycoplasma suis]CBZ40642.1 hypothetical protein MSUIS_05490 [Mycoplasma suis KI3806]
MAIWVKALLGVFVIGSTVGLVGTNYLLSNFQKSQETSKPENSRSLRASYDDPIFYIDL